LLRRRQPIEPLIAPYLEHLREAGQAPRTIEMVGAFLYTLHGGEAVAEVTPGQAAKTVDAWRGHWSVATRRLRLLQARFFWRWLVEEGKARENPFDGLTIVGRVNAGKPQLRIKEAQLFAEVAFKRFDAGYHFALAPLLALMMGMRSSEICDRVVRDVDDGGAVLWIDAGKTKNTRRHLKVPHRLRPLLAQVAEGRSGNEPLWRCFYRRQNLHSLVWSLCDEAKVPRVCTHSLRGLWATLAVESGAACDSVAAALGHGSFEVTAKHYAQPAAVHAASTDRVVSTLFRDRSGDKSGR
jgi:integrase